MMQDTTNKNGGLKEAFDYVAYGSAEAGDPAHQLVILLHGIGFDGHIMKKMAQEVTTLLPQALIIAPHGPESYDPSPHQNDDILKAPQIQTEIATSYNSRQWFDFSGNSAAVYAKLSPLAKKMNSFIDNKRDALGLQDKDIAIMGFSQGAGVGLCTAYLRNQEIACAVGHSTLFLSETEVNSKPPTLFIYGADDLEFSLTAYKESIKNIKAHAAALDVIEVPGLDHRTNSATRQAAAQFIARHLTP